ncbi:uncharacterized protein [Nothobranchius furzeri]|uniref:uncharacterized protein isoform X2 n=1 Tax=Nothobranchius furzeri TaxID=105023 RepID=UPI003904983C
MAACVSPTSATQRKSIWIIGDSYVRRGAQRAADTLGDNLGLPDVCVSWFGWGGLRWKDLLPFFTPGMEEQLRMSSSFTAAAMTWGWSAV